MSHNILPTQLRRWMTPQSPSRRFTSAPAPVTRAISGAAWCRPTKFTYLTVSGSQQRDFFQLIVDDCAKPLSTEIRFSQWLVFYWSNSRSLQHRTSALSQSPPPAPLTPQTRPQLQVQIQPPLIISFSAKGRAWQAWEFHVPRGWQRVVSMKL